MSPTAAPPGDRQPVRLSNHNEVSCRAREILDRIGDKWSLAVVHQLGWGPRRFTELKRGVEGISQRMLTVTLRGLERDGLITRTVHPLVPPRVDYELTQMGMTLVETVCAILAWTTDNAAAIERARHEYDLNHAPEQADVGSA